jgi:hypothetical protein
MAGAAGIMALVSGGSPARVERASTEEAMPTVVPDDGVTALASAAGTLFVGGDFERFGSPTGHFVVFNGLRNRPQHHVSEPGSHQT